MILFGNNNIMQLTNVLHVDKIKIQTNAFIAKVNKSIEFHNYESIGRCLTLVLLSYYHSHLCELSKNYGDRIIKISDITVTNICNEIFQIRQITYMS